MNVKLHPLSLAVAALLFGAAANVAAEIRVDANADAAAEAEASQTLDTVSVIGQGETRQVQRVLPEEAIAKPTGTSPLKLLDKLPGVHVEAADPWGNYEWSTRISLRGFNQNRLGFTLDGIPLGDMSYGNTNGLHISRALIAENLGMAEVAQGSGALGTASTGNLGGTIAFTSSDPLPQYGARLAQTVGSDATRRTYARLDTGDHAGFAAYLSGAYSTTDKWKGWGEQEQTQFNGKAVYDFGTSHLALLVSTSRRNEVDYADYSLDSQRRLGWDWDNYAPDWQRAVDAARGIYSGGVNSLDDAYYLGRGLRDDDLVGLSGDFGLGEGLNLRLGSYYHNNEGQGHWFTPYAPSSATVPISIRTTEYDIERMGYTGALVWQIDNHTLEGGFWYETSVHGLQRNFYGVDGPIIDDYFLRNPALRQFRQRFDTDTTQWYLQDRMSFLDGNLKVDVGFKSQDVQTDATNLIGSRASGSLTAKKNFLPQLGANLRISDGEELFFSYAENQAAFQPGVAGPFSASQAGFDAIRNGLKPERSKSFEGGLRSTHETFDASLALYSTTFDNRLLAISQCSGIQGCPTVFANVGSVRTQGAEATFVWRPIDGLRWFNSLTWTDSQYEDDYLDGTTRIPTDGKDVVDTPRQLFATELSYDLDGFALSLGAKYTGKRYITYVNDSSVSGFWVIDAGASYTFGDIGPLAALKVSANITNLGDRKYFGTVGSNGFVASDPTGLNYTVLQGAPRQMFLTVDAKF
ncbi:TonB-dependent receptor [Tahibacter sp. UC22_41]|uniref:TonB-dependent receptor n=1 Tax=Tahibacter sp. UC22_41 TaxID=3350178 RepID=UPI0036DE31A8